MKFIYIEGLPGSGKTYICHQLSKLINSVCLDIDDLYLEAYKELKLKDRENITILPDLFDAKWDEYYNKYKKANVKLLIIVGVTLYGVGAEKKYFMRLDNIEDNYRKFLHREHDKIIENYDLIVNIINNSNVNLIDLDIIHTINLVFILDYCKIGIHEYKNEYNQLMLAANRRKLTIMNAYEIVKDIKLLIEE